MIKDRTSLLLISETLDWLWYTKIFTKIDLKDAYYRLQVREGDKWKIAFWTWYSHFEYCVFPFGLSNTPAIFQVYLNYVLVGLVDIVYVVYLDDLLVFSENSEEHKDVVQQVLERLRTHKLYMNLKKYEFGTDMVEFLGLIVNPTGIIMDPACVEAIWDWATPKTFKEIQMFLGFTNFYRRFIKNYSKVVTPLTDLLSELDQKKN